MNELLYATNYRYLLASKSHLYKIEILFMISIEFEFMKIWEKNCIYMKKELIPNISF